MSGPALPALHHSLSKIERQSFSMIKDEPLPPGWGGVDWVQIDAHGGESARRGGLWAPAPRIRTLWPWWVIPEDGGAPVPVVFTSKRHRCRRGAGRWVDVGENYSDVTLAVDVPRSPWRQAVIPGHLANSLSVAPRRRFVEPLPKSVLQMLLPEPDREMMST